MLDRDSPVPLYLQIEDWIRDRVESGEIGLNERVPSELSLSKEFSVSRMTARKAVDRLVNQGTLFRRQGKGTFVAPPRIVHGLSTHVSFSKAMTALGIQHRTKVLFAGMEAASEHVRRALDLPPGALVARVSRVRYLRDIPMAVHETFVISNYGAVIDHDLTGSLTDAMAAEGAIIGDVRDSVEADAATDDIAELLEVSEGTPVIRIFGIGFMRSGLPLRYTEAFYRGDAFRFSVDTRHAAELLVEVKQSQP